MSTDYIPQDIKRIALDNVGCEYSTGDAYYQGRSYTIRFEWSDMDNDENSCYIVFEPDSSSQGLAWHYFCNVYRNPETGVFEVLDYDEHPDLEQDLKEAA